MERGPRVFDFSKWAESCAFEIAQGKEVMREPEVSFPRLERNPTMDSEVSNAISVSDPTRTSAIFPSRSSMAGWSGSSKRTTGLSHSFAKRPD
ncbi:hypothetical protein [Leptospira jelokensis]|uniref:hypothetical protein n=1 Tax=Leptospira jelokensis TaxID=2484931 RepID=UPI0010910132|nr:hypothetical protein [Leptospira jelokensis]TGM06533.1 hypothetical protein EHQ79_00820 [Leptospira jelokensis]